MLDEITDYKSLRLAIINELGTFEFYMRFVDVREYAADVSFDEFSCNFGGNESRVEVLFSYEILTLENYHKVLSSFEPFDPFNSNPTFTKSNICDFDYQKHLEDLKHYLTRKEYLLHYNWLETQIMTPTLKNIINLTLESSKIDRFHNISLSRNVSQCKYEAVSRNFDFNAKYSQILTQTMYLLDEKYWKRKCNEFEHKVRQGNRPIDNMVTPSEFIYFKNLHEYVLSAIYRNCFISENMSSYDGTDN